MVTEALVVPQKGPRNQTNVTVGTSAIQLVAGNINRKSVTFQNQGAGTVHLGPSTVDISGASRGYALFAGASFTDNASTDAWWAISESATNIVNCNEIS